MRKVYTKLDDLCRDIAYSLWEEAGQPDGLSDHFWFEAEKILCEMGLNIRIRHSLVDLGYFYCPYIPNVDFEDVKRALGDYCQCGPVPPWGSSPFFCNTCGKEIKV